MECYYHPDREGTDQCAICGKSICKECGLEIAGKIYCKECLEKIVGIGIGNAASQSEPVAAKEPEPIRTEPARLHKQPLDDAIYQPPAEDTEIPYTPQEEQVQKVPEIKQIQDDSPYNIKDNIDYSAGPESYPNKEPVQPQVSQNEYPSEPIAQQPVNDAQEFIYPDHSYEPEPTSARVELEDKYEKYLDDLYFDENEVPLEEQLAKDEEQFGSLTRKPYEPKKEPAVPQKMEMNKPETPEEMEARIRAEILAEQQGLKKPKKDKDEDNAGIHNLNYQDEKEPMGAVDIILTIILIIVILVVAYYIIYILLLSSVYPTFMDSIYALSNPQNVINNVLTPK